MFFFFSSGFEPLLLAAAAALSCKSPMERSFQIKYYLASLFWLSIFFPRLFFQNLL